MTVRVISVEQMEQLAFDNPGAQIERNPKHHTLHLTLDGVRYSAREAA